MKRVLQFIAFLLLCSPAFGQCTSPCVQDNFGGPGTTVSSVTATLTGTAAGNAIVAIIPFGASSADYGVCTDSQNNNYGLYVQDAIGSGAATAICTAFNIAGGNDTITCKSLRSSYSSFYCYVMEVHNVYAVDSVAYLQGTSGTSLSFNTTTTLSGDFLVAGIWASGNPGTWSAGAGWTPSNVASHYAAWMHQVAGAAGSYTTNWTWTLSTVPVGVSIALKSGANPTIGTSPATKVEAYIHAGSGGTTTCAFPGNVSTGDILYATATTSSGTVTGLSDTRSTTWGSPTSVTVQGTTKLWIAPALSNGANTVTFTGTSITGSSCGNLSSTLATSTIDAFVVGSFEGTPNVQTTSSITTTVNGDVLLCITGGAGGSSPLPWPVDSSSYLTGGGVSSVLYRVLGAAQPVTCSFATAGFTAGNYIMVALKPAAAIALVTSALPSASTSHSYSYPLYAVQGAGSYTWSISSGSLPTGLSINSSTGVISGTPTGGTQTFTVQVTDGTNTTTRSLTLTVNSSASTPSFIQANLTQIGTTISFTSVAVGDVLWVCAQDQNNGGAGNIALPTDSLGTPTIFHPVGQISSQASTPISTITESTTTFCWAGQATASGADTVTFGSGSFVPSGMQFRNVQPFYDSTVFTTGAQTTANQTFTSTSLTTPTPNSMSAGIVTVNPGAPSSITAQSPYTDAGSLLADNHIVDLGYNLFASVTSAAFSSSIVGGVTTAAWSMAMTHLRPSTSGVVSSLHPRAWVNQN